MLQPKLEEHYGKMVWTNVKMDGLRKDECLCLNCNKIRTCSIAKALHEICKSNDIAMAITRCPLWI